MRFPTKNQHKQDNENKTQDCPYVIHV